MSEKGKKDWPKEEKQKALMLPKQRKNSVKRVLPDIKHAEELFIRTEGHWA